MDELVPAWFEAAEHVVEASLGAALVGAWLLALAFQLAGPYAAAAGRKVSVKLAADILSTGFGLLRAMTLVCVFLLSFIYFYPDVVLSNDLPITGGIAACFALAAMVMKLIDDSPGGRWGFRRESILLGVGAALYVVPYVLGTQLTDVAGSIGPIGRDLTAGLISSHNQSTAVALCALSQELALLLGAVAVVYTLRRPSPSSEARA